MRLQDRRWHECLSAWSGAIVLAVWSLCIGVVPAVASSRPYRVAVLTPGLPFNLALEGLREGLTQLGYHEGKDVIFLVEDAQGEIVSLASRATKLVTAKPDIIFTIGTAATAVAKQATTTLPIVFTWVGGSPAIWLDRQLYLVTKQFDWDCQLLRPTLRQAA